MLEVGESVLDVVMEVVCLLEECLLFNVGIGVVFTCDEIYELDVCVMDGNILKVGVVVGVSYLCNLVFVVWLVME